MTTVASPTSAFAVPVLLVAVLATMVGIASTIPGTFFSNDLMNNQRLTIPLKGGIITPTQNGSSCLQKCVDHAECDAYAYSTFHKTCQIYKTNKTNTAVLQNMYKLFIREKTNEEGFYKWGTNYIMLILQSMNAYDASSYCAKDNGLLVAILDEKMNKLVAGLLHNVTVFSAIIGLTDQQEEGVWLNSLGAKDPYTNFYFTDTWYRRDRNCAYIRIDKSWAQMNCMDKRYFVCQYPMF